MAQGDHVDLSHFILPWPPMPPLGRAVHEMVRAGGSWRDRIKDATEPVGLSQVPPGGCQPSWVGLARGMVLG